MKTAHDLKRGVDFIGVTCVFVCHDGQGNILLHKRSQNCRDEQGKWDNGAGSLEFGETIEDGVRREVREEYGVEAEEVRFVLARSVLRENNGTPTHWIALLHVVKVPRDQVKMNDPEYMDEIGWFTLETMPENVHSQLWTQFELVKPFLSPG